MSESVFRYGSKAWGELLCEARALYNQGLITELDEDDFYLLESDAGELADMGGMIVMLDTPQINWDVPGSSYVFVRTTEGVQRVDVTD